MMLAKGALLEGTLFLPLSEAGRDVEIEVKVQARLTHGMEVRDGRGVLTTFELGMEFLEISDDDCAELRRFLFEWLAADSGSHGWEDDE